MKRNPGRPRKGREILVTISGRVPPDLKSTIERMKDDEQSSTSAVMCRLLEQGLAVDGVLARRSANAA